MFHNSTASTRSSRNRHGRLLLSALFAAATAVSGYAFAHGDRDADRSSPVGAWECEDTSTGAPYLVTFMSDHTLRTTLPNPEASDTHALWRRTGRGGFAVTGRALLYADGQAFARGRSDATGVMTSSTTISASVTNSFAALDGTPLGEQAFVLECTRVSFD